MGHRRWSRRHRDDHWNPLCWQPHRQSSEGAVATSTCGICQGGSSPGSTAFLSRYHTRENIQHRQLSALDKAAEIVLCSLLPTVRFVALSVSTPKNLLSYYWMQASWEPSAVGYIRHEPKIYEAPVYITSFRGPTYVFLATLKTEDPVSKWTLTGTAILLQTDE